LDVVYNKSAAYLCNPGNCYCTADLANGDWNTTALMALSNETDLRVNITELKSAWVTGDWRTVVYGIKTIFGITGAKNL